MLIAIFYISVSIYFLSVSLFYSAIPLWIRIVESHPELEEPMFLKEVKVFITKTKCLMYMLMPIVNTGFVSCIFLDVFKFIFFIPKRPSINENNGRHPHHPTMKGSIIVAIVIIVLCTAAYLVQKHVIEKR